eukprot:TRINITY_DN559_c0_g1_i2.p1 TRINITY_DN559_c0_g1~~TRINITY_DN559_c0_g1_i2.p1  ORF type:complete len:217 (+),score=47.23 TRINITY_DN559_c0_g1_i2:402-1052(+)
METPTRTLKIEVIGDSLSCGYGDLGDNPYCDWSTDTEDSTLSWGSLVAQNFSAQLYIEAWSGMGIVRNYGDPNTTSEYPFPTLFPRTLGSSDTSPEWDFKQYQPDVVLVNLGTNDYSTAPTPPHDVFVDGYVSFLTSLRGWYPNAELFAVCGPVTTDECCQAVSDAVDAFGDAHFVYALNILSWPTDYGCDTHPSITGQQKLAAKVIPAVAGVMGW